jgi:hypothetical protein
MRIDPILHVSVVVFACVFASCGSSNCVKQFPPISNQNRTRSANLEISACGGATVGYVTDLKITRSPSNFFGDDGNVWTVKDSVDADLRWITPTQLEVSYRAASFKEEDVIRRTTRWFDVDIVYRPKTSDRDSSPQR